MAPLIPELRQRETIQEYLGLPPEVLSEALEFLENIGLAGREKGQLKVTQKRMHIGTDSKLLIRHHTNLRLQAIRSLECMRPTDLHYGSFLSICRSDFNQLRENLVRIIEENCGLVRDSKDETLACVCIDFFSFPI